MPEADTAIDAVVAPVFHNNEPEAVVLNVELPQLLTTVTDGADGVDLGDAAPVPAPLIHPFTVVVTLYVPATVTVINVFEEPVLQCKVPAAVVLKVELPQPSTSVTTGGDGITLGAARALPFKLVQPFIV